MDNSLQTADVSQGSTGVVSQGSTDASQQVRGSTRIMDDQATHTAVGDTDRPIGISTGSTLPETWQLCIFPLASQASTLVDLRAMLVSLQQVLQQHAPGNTQMAGPVQTEGFPEVPPTRLLKALSLKHLALPTFDDSRAANVDQFLEDLDEIRITDHLLQGSDWTNAISLILRPCLTGEAKRWYSQVPLAYRTAWQWADTETTE